MVQFFVTYLDCLGPNLLRVFGQMDPKHMEVVQANIDSVLSQANHAEPVRLEVGLLCLARRFNKYSRARVLALESRDSIRVHFIDYGDDQTIPIQELQPFKLPKILENFPKQASSYILSGVLGNWKPYQIQDICGNICNTLADLRMEMEIGEFKFVRLTVGTQDFANYIIEQKGIGFPISIEELRDTFCLLMDKSHKIKPPPVSINNITKATARNIVPVRGVSQGNNMNMEYYSVSPMVSPAPMANVPRTDGSVINSTGYNPAIMGMNVGHLRMPYKAPDNMTYYTQSPEEIELQISPKRSVATFKSNTLMVGKVYDVYCCYVENGPCSFSIHLKANMDSLAAMMSELENIPLKNLIEKPSLGMACIARYSLDGHLYRAVIMSIKPTACQVAYVDYGHTETVTFSDLYEIPAKFLNEKVFAIRFALSGYKDLEPIDELIKNTFNDMVLYHTLKLKVMPLEGPPLVQYCELHDGKLNIHDALKNHANKKLQYSQPESLQSNDLVVICYVESPKKFFVQKVANKESFEQMMDDLFLYCKQTRKALTNLSTGAACAVKFENAWYRAQITGSSGNRVSIRHVDFGNERKVDPSQLCSLTDRLVQFPPQAVQCCLKGFENTETLSDTVTVQMEMLAESDDDRRHFKCQIFKTEQDGSAVVNLIDSSMRPELNLMKRLYKLSMPFNKYIGLEKEDGNFEMQSISRINQNDSHSSVINTNAFVNEPAHSTSSDWDSGNVHSAYQPPSSDCGSSGSGDTRDTRNSCGDGRSKRFQSRKPFKENRREQPYSTFKGKNLPPRFQRQNENTRRFKENKFNESYETPRFSSENSDKFSQYTPKTQEHQAHEIQSDDTWGQDDGNTIVDKQMQAMEEYLPPESAFVKQPLAVPIREDAIICWWISPHQFYTHLKSKTEEFEKMMKQMQMFYKNKTGVNSILSIGSCVIARYREDNILYRAKIIACNQSLRKYKVEFVDFGNQSTAGESDIYLVEKRFSSFPVMAHLCAFENVISNFDHNYITSKVEHYIKGNNSITCEYLRMEQDGFYYVNVEVNGSSLKELMINDGLLSALETDMKLEMLAGQQIKATILSITDLLNFKIEIEGCGFELLCSYNDIKFVKSNPHLSSEFRGSYEGVSCIVDVVDVTGEKILMLQPHIALFTNELPSTICNYPVLYQSMTVRVAYVLNENKIYVHPVIVDDILSQLLDDMFNFYNEQGEILKDPKPGMVCASNYNGNWYRARITSILNDSVEIYYFDYGNSEVIDSIETLKVLDNSFYNSSALAVGVYLPLKSINDKEEAVINEIQTLTNGYELTLHMIERYKSCWIGDISCDGYSLISVLEDKSLVQGRDMEYIKNLIDHECANKVAIPQSTIIQKTAIQTPEVVVNNQSIQPIESTIETSVDAETQDEYTKNMISAYLSHCDNPGRFFLHLTKDFDELTKLQDNIQIVAGSLPPLMRIVTGAPCIALYSVDDTWYRAKIIDNEIMAVQFIDYGNTDVITDSTYIKEMNEAFAKIAPFAVSCSLTVAPKGTIDWIDEANTIFNESFDKTVYFNYVAKNEKKNFIDLVIDGQNVGEKLIADGLARQLETVRSGENCFISHINSLSDFYIQMELDADALELIAGHLAGYEDFPVLTNPEEGVICAALFPEDGEWYRAKILSQTDEGIEVLFMDYGNTSVTNEVRHISDEIASLPFLSKKCSLRMPENILGWSDSAEAKFSELSAQGQTVFIVQLAEPGDHAVIELYEGTRNIFEDLEPLCDKKPKIDMDSSIISEKERLPSMSDPDLRNVIISHLNSPMNFYVQFTTDNDQLCDITNALNSGEKFEKLENPEIDTICIAVFPDDDALYRAKVLSVSEEGFNVLFIDYGNSSVTSEIFVLPENLKSIESLAKCCALENLSSHIDFESNKAIENFNSILETLGSETLQIEIVNRVVDPWIVRIFCSHKNINKELTESLTQNGEEEKGTRNIFEDLEPLCDKKPKIDMDSSIISEKERLPSMSDPDLRNVIISHLNSPMNFYVQFTTDNDQLCDITNALNSGEEFEKLENPEIDTICIAVFPDDDALYRAKVLSVSEEGFNVLFIDYGNSSVTSEIFVLPENLKSIEGLAKCCALENLSSHIDFESNKAIENFNSILETLGSETLQIEIVNRVVDPWIVRIFCSHKNINKELTESLTQNGEEEKGTRNIFEDLEPLCDKKSKIDMDSSIISEKERLPSMSDPDLRNVIISHLNSPMNFYVQFTTDNDQLCDITNALNSGEEFEKLENPEIDTICIAVFPDDDALYRAKVLSVSEEGFNVLFIDYGNSSVTSEIFVLPENLKSIEGLAKCCALENLSSHIDFESNKAIENFNSILETLGSETLQIEIVNRVVDPWIVRIFCSHKNINKELTESLTQNGEEEKGTRNIFEDLEPLCDKKSKIDMDSSIISEKERLPSMSDPDLRNVIISHLNSPMNFYVQFTTDNDQLCDITNALNSGEEFEKLENPEIDTICIAVFPDDDALYRAKVLSVSEEGFNVLFIDYGNSSVTSEIFVLPENLKSIEGLAKCCALENLSSHIDFESNKAIENFNSILETLGSETLQIEIVNRVVDPWIVRIFCSHKNINKELTESLTQNGEEVTDKQIVEEILQERVELALQEVQNTQEKVTTDPEHICNFEPDLQQIDETPLDDTSQNNAESREQASAASDEVIEVVDPSEALNAEQVDEDGKNKNEPSPALSLEHLDKDEDKSKESSTASSNEKLDETFYESSYEHLPEGEAKENKEPPAEPILEHSDVDEANGWKGPVAIPSIEFSVQDEEEEKSKITAAPSLEQLGEVKESRGSSTASSHEDLKEAGSKDVRNAFAAPSVEDLYVEAKGSREPSAAPSVEDFVAALSVEDLYVEAKGSKEPSAAPSVEDLLESEGKGSGESSAASSVEDPLESEGKGSGESSAASSAEDPLESEGKGSGQSSAPSLESEGKGSGESSAASSVEDPLESEGKGSRESFAAPSAEDLLESEGKGSGESSAASSVEDPLESEGKGSRESFAAPSVEDLLESEGKGSGQSSAASSVEELYVDSKKNKELSETPSVEHLSEPETKESKDPSRVNSLEDLSIKARGSEQSSATPSIEHLKDEENITEKPSVIPSFDYSDEKDQSVVIASPILCAENLDGSDSKQNEPYELDSDQIDKSKEMTGLSLPEDFPSTESETVELRLQSVLISHVLSPREFYVQLQSKSLGLKKFKDLLEVAQNYEKLTEPKVGNFCIANSPDDGAYYRAKILSIDKDDVEVYLIDYGNKVTTCDLRVIPEDLPALEPVALKCSIAEVAGIDLDEQQTIDKFNSLLESHFGEPFEMQTIKQIDETTVVKLYFQKACIGEKLQTILNEGTKEPEIVNRFKKIFICHTNSPVDFYIQCAEDIPQLEKISESLTRANEFETAIDLEAHELYAAKFTDDGAFYRAKILSKTDSNVDVLFVDFGNKDTTDDIKILPKDLLHIKSMANHCRLENKCDHDFFTESASDLFCSLIASHLNEIFQAEIVDDSSDPWVIKLFHEGHDLREKLVKGLRGLKHPHKSWEGDAVELTRKTRKRKTMGGNTNVSSSHEVIAFDEKKLYSSIELGEELLKGYIESSASSKIRADSTSNIPQKLVEIGSDLSLSVQEKDTRSKSSDCLNVTSKK